MLRHVTSFNSLQFVKCHQSCACFFAASELIDAILSIKILKYRVNYVYLLWARRPNYREEGFVGLGEKEKWGEGKRAPHLYKFRIGCEGALANRPDRRPKWTGRKS